MSNIIEGNGSCVCGSVRVIAKKMNSEVGACHCEDCRKWGSGALLAVDCGSDVSFEGEENITVFNSSDWAERGFCKHCGTHLFYRLKQNQQHIMSVGLFDNDKEFVFDHQIFIDKKPEFYSFANETKNKTGAEVFAEFAPPAE